MYPQRINPPLPILITAIASIAAGSPPHDQPNQVEKHRGVSWVAGREITRERLQPLVDHHVNYIVQTPFGWQKHTSSTEIALITDGRVFWGETDEGLRVTTKLARDLGIKTLLKPHIWLMDTAEGKWVADIRFNTEDDWRKWFDGYRRFILHYARFAETNGIEALCVGTELKAAAVEREHDWRALIAEIRTVYRGRLTYAANWHAEFEEIKFWDNLDFIGIQAYFPLSEIENPSLEELKTGWMKHLGKIEQIQRRFDKPVLFTELGYASTPEAARKPWEWPKHGNPGAIDLELQARCYEAFFQTLWDKPWFAGVYWWKWYPRTRTGAGANNADYTPQGKPAEEVMARWFGKEPQ